MKFNQVTPGSYLTLSYKLPSHPPWGVRWVFIRGSRYYALWLGRWCSCDPIGIGDGVNVYGYVSGNPV
ncbi:MAG: hypothetical protein D3909_15000, partial [Candidatus Electrothrix sp. ATG1]|nr:hypothetical protein [Candidatus Electrothrix sp. ATG1]